MINARNYLGQHLHRALTVGSMNQHPDKSGKEIVKVFVTWVKIAQKTTGLKNGKTVITRMKLNETWVDVIDGRRLPPINIIDWCAFSVNDHNWDNNVPGDDDEHDDEDDDEDDDDHSSY